MSFVIHTHFGQSDEIADLLTQAGIKHRRRTTPMGVPMNSGQAIEIATDLAPHAVWASALATVLKAWISARSTRKANITTKENSVEFITEGMSAKETEALLLSAKKLMVFDTDPPRKKKG